MDIRDRFLTGFGLVYAVLAIGLAIGWVSNLVKFVTNLGHIDPVWVARIVGIFVAPLGGIMGWL